MASATKYRAALFLYVLELPRSDPGNGSRATVGESASASKYKFWVESRVARWLIFIPKTPIFVNFGGPYIGKC
jgi:hypothetical protein